MSLTNVQALDVVLLSVKEVGGTLIGPTDSLEKGGIDDDRLPALKSEIVADPDHGVKKYGHRLDAAALSGISTDDSAQDVADVVRGNATPVVTTATAAAAAPEERARKSGGRGRKKAKRGTP